MTLQAQYAAALFELVSAHPEKAREYLANLKALLAKKGHQKLAPRVLREYQFLLERRERSARAQQESPEAERTRVLLELYRTLVATP